MYAQASGDNGTTAVYGIALSSTSATPTYGVSGRAMSTTGVGVFGLAASTSGATTGVYGRVESSSGVAAEFNNGGGGTVLIGRSADVKVFRVDGNGKVFANGGTQVGGADFAESVAVDGEREKYSPGDVIVIDRTADRRFTLASVPYSTDVAGIFATKPGVLGTPHSMDAPELEREIPMAMVGIVPCKASTENGAIARGDLLVTSATPGHVMRGTDRSRMIGAIVAKALQPLEAGKGLIQCMVTLQ